ncbi:hypothetical protein MAFF212519_28770 [Clavibacter michiganensis]
MVGDLLEALLGDPATGGDVAEERDDVVLALGAAEGREQDRVVRDGLLHVGGAHLRGLARGGDEGAAPGGVGGGGGLATQVHCGHYWRTSTSSAVVMRRPV